MKLTPKDYQGMADKAAPSTKSYITIPSAFVIGGAICMLGQAIQTLYITMGLERDIASSSTSVTLILLSALLTGLQVYDKIARYGGAGTLVPITGFANAMVSPALEFKTEGLVTGTAAKLFTVAGPVLVFGISASVVYGVVYFLLL